MATTKKEPLRIVELRSENVKRLRAVRLRLEGKHLQVIGGRNAQGKTSLLDSVEMLLRGGAAIPAQPVRRGAKEARISADLGSLVVERKIRANRSHVLEVRDASGKLAKPQQILDELCQRIAFDPLEFSTMDPAKQDATLRALVGLDTSALDHRESICRDERARINRELKAAKAVLGEMPARYGDVPEEEQTSAELLVELEAAEQERADQSQARQALSEYDRETERMQDEEDRLNLETETLRAKLEELDRRADELSESIDKRRQDREELQIAVDSLEEPDLAGIRERLAGLEETNRKVRANAARSAKQAEVDRLERESEQESTEIQQIQEERERQQAEAEYPVPGLSFDPAGGVLLNGLPFDQASQAERLRVSVGIGFALNPGIAVLLVRDGSLLDDEHLALLGKLAQEHHGQLLVERVGSQDAGAVVIEDGEVLQ
jgi:hypothetical protein